MVTPNDVRTAERPLADLRIGRGTPTPQLLQRLRTALLVAVLATLVGSLLAFLGARAAIVTVKEQAVPAARSLSDIWTDLHTVDAGLSGCATVPALTAGKPDCAVVLAIGEYHGTIADVVQDLAVLAERHVGTPADRQSIRVVQGLLIRYLGLVEQAHFHLGQGHTLLAEAYLRYASNLLRGSIHSELDTYRTAVQKTVTSQRGSQWRSSWMVLLWLLPLLTTLGLLVVSQLYLTARFNRWVSWPLAVSSLCLVVLGVAAGQPRWAGGGFGRSTRSLATLVGTPLPADGSATAPSGDVVSEIGSAARSFHLEYVMVVLACAVVALVVVAFQRRLDEYRLRSR